MSSLSVQLRREQSHLSAIDAGDISLINGGGTLRAIEFERQRKVPVDGSGAESRTSLNRRFSRDGEKLDAPQDSGAMARHEPRIVRAPMVRTFCRRTLQAWIDSGL
jgi:hypothetical protein